MVLASDIHSHAELRLALDAARAVYWEDPQGSLATAIACDESARALGARGLRARALALQGAISVHLGDLRGAVALATEAESHADHGDVPARVELEALQAHLSFFSGANADALAHAERAVELAERDGDRELRIFAGRAGCLVFGNLGVRDLPDRLRALLRLTIEAGNRWEQAISHNDMSCVLQGEGDLEGAERELERGMEVAGALAPRNGFALGVLHSTRADMRLLAGRPQEALADAEEAMTQLTARGEPNPYVFGITVRAHVQALQALGRLEEAQESGEGALSRLGDRVPHARGLILTVVATALREAGRLEEAYDTLARSAALEREASRQLSELQLGLERARLEARAARGEADMFAAQNRELGDAHAELERRTELLERLQEQLRDQADHDHLTGLHNRRFLARELERLSAALADEPVSLAVVDLDHFKAINDAHGHDAGDRVLVRVAALLVAELRERDIVVRTGGEEFVILLPGTEPNAAIACAERLRAAIREEPWGEIAAGMTLTASVGVASSPGATDMDSLAKAADRRLYEAKRAGRDCVVSAS